jgi:hypothetical protein
VLGVGLGVGDVHVAEGDVASGVGVAKGDVPGVGVPGGDVIGVGSTARVVGVRVAADAGVVMVANTITLSRYVSFSHGPPQVTNRSAACSDGP